GWTGTKGVHGERHWTELDWHRPGAVLRDSNGHPYEAGVFAYESYRCARHLRASRSNAGNGAPFGIVSGRKMGIGGGNGQDVVEALPVSAFRRVVGGPIGGARRFLHMGAMVS